MLFRHLLRYNLAVTSGWMSSEQSAERKVRKQVNGACLRELFSGSAPRTLRGN